MRTQSQTAFPVGLYGLCLFALCAIAVPALGHPLARVCLGAASLPLRLWGALGTEASASSTTAAASVKEITARLQTRLEADVLRGARDLMPSSYTGHVCPVAATPRTGGASLPSELRLQLTHAEVEHCLPLVTVGEDLVGFLCRPGEGPALLDQPTDPARVLLVNHQEGRRIAAAVTMPTGATLRLVVEPAAAVDPAPLRSCLWEDPYRAADPKQMVSDLEVRTATLTQQPWAGIVPGGLRLGRTFVWGYASVTIGVYVHLSFEPRTLSHVVLWQPSEATPLPTPTSQVLPAVLRPLPGGAAESGHLQAALGKALPDGAAVVQDGICLGLLRSLAFGQGLVTSFASSRRRWTLLFLPDDDTAAPLPLLGEVTAARDQVAWVRTTGSEVIGGGWLFTGSNGPGCPPCLLLGRAEPDAASGLLRVVLQATEGPTAVEVLLPAGGPR